MWAKFPADGFSTSKRESGASGSVAFATELLDRTGVLVAPGVVFGAEYDTYVRFSAVVTEERMREVVDALSRSAFLATGVSAAS